MPKMKTRKSAAKRLKVTGTGKILKRMPGRSHLLSNKSGKRIREGRQWAAIPASFQKQLRRLLGL